ncbi:tRNA (N6-threonylcarbamoyladenosine(37)-N6)-methyltransferase TrmO [Desulfoprunum benzoelyticum]|uniref:tRNA-Thr(GGU) m(6)t(6)A37 methyltransferase TsaA n=1 Tax=Desulfoprunum benzoelyticum TaxID=1506996 RepID=A0A840UVL7_9BACT|nr:tRNA (N6-threonylcarbamoyladenosine(37)-N6)-methyltransferase TrmO [Desulfoprunum benzoelyticum]MBB5349755.1 tRNA-Thr(GGU) m(6)t(6)A37 methyltransferase TsaA [Desulfoprunum benzoelyticum]MBM9531881.1 tRNA (N6-threonylcarbamoyladenosine(37)-N6)-methyltransferase TrmO [Desulfoprunum benzoelyticum]
MHTIDPIGVILSPHKSIEDMPIQPKGASEFEGQVIVNEKYIDGLHDLDGFSHIYLLYSFHKASRTEMIVTPFMDKTKRGVFATRSPLRPNHIGISIVNLLKVERNIVFVKGIDVLDGTPLLDIKPYIEQFDVVHNSVSGWLQASDEEIRNKRSDERFR